MKRAKREAISVMIGSVRIPAATADLGVPATLLPSSLAGQYVVESHYEDEIMNLIQTEPSRLSFLEKLAPELRGLFGENARLMLAQLWSLFDPIGPELHVVVYTWLDERGVRTALDALRKAWNEKATQVGVHIMVTRMYRDPTPPRTP